MAERPPPEETPPSAAGPPVGVPAAAPSAERVADADRERTVTLLREHVVEGRLTLDEFSERMGTALEARTRGELDAVLADLPAAAPDAPAALAPREQRRWHVAVLSGHSTQGRWRIRGKTNAVAVMGGCHLDLRRAEIEGPEAVITAVSFWGGVEIIVPEGFDVELRGFSFMGGRTLRLRDVPVVRGSPRIVVRGYSVMGGVHVKSRSGRSGRSDRQLARSSTDQADPVAPHVPPEVAAAAAADVAGPGEPSDGTVTVLFCDMVDYAGMTERLGDQASHRVLRELHRIVREAVARHDGREVSVQGDGFMVAFGGVARALRCAREIQRAVRARVPFEGDETIAVHIGVNTGDALSVGDDYLGQAVIVASRLADAAGSGEILVSSLSAQLVAGSGEFAFDPPRELTLKGLEQPQPSAALRWEV